MANHRLALRWYRFLQCTCRGGLPQAPAERTLRHGEHEISGAPPVRTSSIASGAMPQRSESLFGFREIVRYGVVDDGLHLARGLF